MNINQPPACYLGRAKGLIQRLAAGGPHQCKDSSSPCIGPSKSSGPLIPDQGSTSPDRALIGA
jgi:hypothetical protein